MSGSDSSHPLQPHNKQKHRTHSFFTLRFVPKYKSHPLAFLPSGILGFFVSASLPEISQDFEQWQQNRHTHGQEEWYVDGKLLIVRKVEEMEQWGVKEGSLRRWEGFFAVLQGKTEVPSLQLSNSQLKWCDSAGYLSDIKVPQWPQYSLGCYPTLYTVCSIHEVNFWLLPSCLHIIPAEQCCHL